MKIKNFLYNASCALLMGSVLMTAMGCPDKGKEGQKDRKEVTACGDVTEKTDCNNSKQKSGENCKYDDAAQKCVVDVTASDYCKNMSNDDAKCKADKKCTWDDKKNPKCQDADKSVLNKCEAIQAQKPCTDDKTCKWNAGKCETAVFADKDIMSFEMAKLGKGALDAANYGIGNDDTIKGVSASLDGNFVYIVGTAAATLVAKNVTNPADPWANVSANWAQINDAADASNDLDFSAKPVVNFAPLSDGLLFSTATNRILAQVRGKGGNDVGIQGWAKATVQLKNQDEAPQALASIKKADGTELLYLSHHNPANNVLFEAKRVIPAGANANDGISNGGFGGVGGQLANLNNTLANTKKYKQFFQAPNGDLLMVADDGLSVDRLNAADVGENAKDITGGHGDADYFEASDGNALHRVGGYNNPIKQCATVDKYIVCGMTLADPTQDGGIAVYDTTSGAAISAAASWRWLADGATVAHDFVSIAVDQHHATKKNRRALIFVKTGFYIFEDGDFVKPFETAPSKLVNNAVNAIAANVVDYDNAQSGYVAGSVALPAAAGNNQTYLGAAQDVSGLWYIAIKGHGNNDGGVFTLRINEQTFTK